MVLVRDGLILLIDSTNKHTYTTVVSLSVFGGVKQRFSAHIIVRNKTAYILLVMAVLNGLRVPAIMAGVGLHAIANVIRDAMANYNIYNIYNINR